MGKAEKSNGDMEPHREEWSSEGGDDTTQTGV